MSKWSADASEIETRIYRGLVVQEFGPEGVDALDYLGRDWERGSA